VRRRELAEPLESLVITLQPVFPQAEGAVPEGELRIAWGQVEYATEWRMLWP